MGLQFSVIVLDRHSTLGFSLWPLLGLCLRCLLLRRTSRIAQLFGEAVDHHWVSGDLPSVPFNRETQEVFASGAIQLDLGFDDGVRPVGQGGRVCDDGLGGVQ